MVTVSRYSLVRKILLSTYNIEMAAENVIKYASIVKFEIHSGTYSNHTFAK